MAGPQKFAKLADLTPQIYLRYKRQGMTDEQIGRMYNVSKFSIANWKKEQGLIGRINPRSWETKDKWFPEVVERTKKRFLDLYNQGWKHEYIAEELDMTRNGLTRFKDRYFPEMVSRVKIRLTDEQKEIARKNKIRLNTAYKRIQEQGMTIEQAITAPVEKEGWRGDPDKRKIGTKKASECKGDPVVRVRDHLSPEEIEQAKQNGLSQNIVYRRIRMGWPKDRVINEPSRRRKRVKKWN